MHPRTLKCTFSSMHPCSQMVKCASSSMHPCPQMVRIHAQVDLLLNVFMPTDGKNPRSSADIHSREVGLWQDLSTVLACFGGPFLPRVKVRSSWLSAVSARQPAGKHTCSRAPRARQPTCAAHPLTRARSAPHARHPTGKRALSRAPAQRRARASQLAYARPLSAAHAPAASNWQLHSFMCDRSA